MSSASPSNGITPGQIARRVTVDRTRTPKQVLDATGRKQYVDDSVAATMPRGEGAEVEVVFFKLGHFVSDDNLDLEYDRRGLIPCDPYSQAQVNIDDPSFADEHPNGTHWKNDEGAWCVAVFIRCRGVRDVDVYRDDSGWHDHWWFAGIRKPTVACA